MVARKLKAKQYCLLAACLAGVFLSIGYVIAEEMASSNQLKKIPATQPVKQSFLTKEKVVDNVELKVLYVPQYQAGHEAGIKIKVTNEGKKTVKYGVKSVFLNFIIKVKDAQGKPVPITRWGKVVLFSPGRLSPSREIVTELSPKKSIEINVNLARCFDLTLPGEYELSVSWESKPTPSEKSIRLAADPIKFKIK